MSNDIVAVQMSTRCITFNRAQTGFFFRADKTVIIVMLFSGMYNNLSIMLGNGGILSS